MEPREYKRVKISDKDIKAILFRNFAGAPDKYHTDGCMPNFWIVLTDEKGQDLELNERLNIRWKPNHDGDLEPRLQVFVRWDKIPPKVFQKCGDKEVQLDEETVVGLDYADIAHADLILSPNEYDPAKPKKSYLSRGRFTVMEEDWDD